MAVRDHVIIVAAGKGSRMKEALPKQFLELNGKPILLHTLEVFHQFNPSLEIIVVLNSDYVLFWQDLARTIGVDIPHKVVAGGAERFHSVKNGLDAIEEENGIVAIHDAVRPLVSHRTLEECFSVARSKSSAIPVLALNDSIREVKGSNSVIADRSKYRLVQTPQCFELSQLREAFSQDFDPRFTDDASVWESFGYEVQLVEGNRENFKITTPEDLKMASALLNL